MKSFNFTREYEHVLQLKITRPEYFFESVIYREDSPGSPRFTHQRMVYKFRFAAEPESVRAEVGNSNSLLKGMLRILLCY